MERILYTGNYNTVISDDFYKELLDLVKQNREDEFYFILPNGNIINKYRKKLMEDLGVSFSINLFTFDDIVNNLLMIRKENIIGEELKYFIVSKILKDLNNNGELNYYGSFINMHGFIVSVIDIIISIKKELIRSDDFIENLPQGDYYKELGKIYKSYEVYLSKNGLLDREEVYFKAIENLDSENLDLDINSIYIDEFYDFRPIELKLLEKLCEKDLDIYININNLINKETQIINNTISKLKTMGFVENNKIYELEGFSKLGNNIFSGKETIDNVNICKIQGVTGYLEVKSVIEDIKKEYKKGIDLKDICIIPMDENYLNILEDVIQIEKIPINKNLEKPLINFNISREILNILKLGLDDNVKNLVLNRIRSYNFMDLEIEEENKIYTYLKNENFDTINEFKALLNKNKYEIDIDDMPVLIEVLNGIVLEINELLEIKTLKGFNEYIAGLLSKYNVLDEIQSEMNSSLEEFKNDIQIYNYIFDILDELNSFALYEDQFELGEYIKILEDYFKSVKITSYFKNDNGINILNLIDSRGFEFENVYIMGLSQNIYPNIKDDNFFYQERNRKDIKTIGLKYDTYDEKLENDILKISKLISSVKNKLVLSYTKGENGEFTTSLFLDEIIRNTKEYDEIDIDFESLFKENIDDITNRKDYRNYILRNIFDENVMKYEYKLDNEKLEILNEKLNTMILRKSVYGKFNGKMEDLGIIGEFNNKFNDYKFSATTLDNYGKCPFSFFMNYILKLEELYLEHGEDFLKLGNLYHNVLNDFYSLHYKKDMTREDVIERLEEIFNKYVEELEFPNKNKLEELYIKDKYKKLESFIIMDLERIIEQEIIPIEFEKTFGKDTDFLVGNTKVMGKIDRVDKIQDKTIIIDYKTSGISKLEDMKSGISFQMPIYLLAKADENPVAGLYGVLKDGKYKVGVALDKSIKEAMKIRSNKFNSKEELDSFLQDIIVQVDEIRESIIKGEFNLDPKSCNEYCIYRNICRYEDR